MPSDTYTLAGRTVHRIGFGAMQLPGRRVFGPPADRDAALDVLRRAVALGVDHIDTAQYYGPDVANELIREALHPYPDGLQLVSKVGARRDDRGRWLPADTPAELRSGVEDNLRSLEVEQLAAVNLRRMDGAERGDAPEVPFAEQLAELHALREEGKIAGVGISNVSTDDLRTALELGPVACVQNGYNLLTRGDEPTLELCREHEIPYVPFFPLGSAFTKTKVADHEVVQSVASEIGATAAQVALAWLLHRRPNLLLIPGTSSVAHLEENLGARDVRLGVDALQRLEAIAPPSAPSGAPAAAAGA